MANELQEKLDAILEDKQANLLPENLKKGVTLLGIEGSLENDGVISQDTYDGCMSLADAILGDSVPYIPVEYIEATGTQWVDTEVGTNASSIKIETKFVIPEEPNDGFLWAQFVINESDNLGTYGLGSWYIDANTNKFTYFYGNNEYTSLEQFNTNTEYVLSSEQSLTEIKTTLNGVASVQTRAVSSLNQPIVLFWRGNDPSPRHAGTYSIYYFKIYIDNELVRDFIPAKDWANRYGLYDKVSSTFFYSNSDSDFVGGGVI